jgi:hypothetical protein
MRSNSRAIVLLSLWALAFSTNAQEPSGKPQTIATAPKTVEAEVQLSGNDRIQGKLIFTPTLAHPDDTLSGKLEFKVAENSRRAIAEKLNKALTEVPEGMFTEEVFGIYEKAPSCPQLNFEFNKQSLLLMGLKVNLNKFVLTFVEDSSQLSKLLCRCARAISGGRSRCPYKVINSVLKGEKIE